MRRRLIVMRHAKSSWAEAGQGDHARPLNDRGRRDAPRIGERLVELGWTPDAVWSSDAERARETAALMVPAFDLPPAQVLDGSLYLAGLRELRTAAARWDAAWATVLVLGHNPGWELAASNLADARIEMTTANAVLLEAEGAPEAWAEALSGAWTLEGVLRPREL